MEVLKVKNGSNHQDISGIGKITVKKDLVFSFMQMEISMKACGLVIKDMVKVLTGEMKVVN